MEFFLGADPATKLYKLVGQKTAKAGDAKRCEELLSTLTPDKIAPTRARYGGGEPAPG